MLMDPRRGKKERSLFEKACEAIKTEIADVALKNTDGWTNPSNVLIKFDRIKSKRHNEDIGTLLVFVSARTPIGDKTSRSVSFPRPVCSRLSSPRPLSRHTNYFSEIPSMHLFKFSCRSRNISPVS